MNKESPWVWTNNGELKQENDTMNDPYQDLPSDTEPYFDGVHKFDLDWIDWDKVEDFFLDEPGVGLDRQVGGTHYQELAVQPMEYSYKNRLNPIAHSIVKYATRAGRKEGEDTRKEIEKIIHCAEIWLELIEED